MKKKFLSILICTVVIAANIAVPVQAITSQANGITSESIVEMKADIIVDSAFEGIDGSEVEGIKTYSTVQAALNSISSKNTKEIKVVIKSGVYKEKLKIEKPNVTLIGEDPINTVLTYDVASGSIKLPEHGGDGTSTYGTSGSASVTISNKAVNFKAVNLTIENAFDEENATTKSKQAVALKNEADKSIFVNCRFLGNQDTLYVNKNTTQYYYNCYLEGDVDFIFGSATAVFEECEIFSVDRPGISPKGYITAPSTEEGRFGYLILNSALTSDITEKGSVYLGRPWHPSSVSTPMNSNVVYVNTSMGYHIAAKGWDSMSGVNPEDNNMFEYNSTGLGAVEHESRPVLTDEEAEKYSKEAFLGDWDPSEATEELKALIETSVVDLTKNDDQYISPYDIVVDGEFEGEDGEDVDGAATYRTVQAAINSISKNNAQELTVFLKKGTYKEKLTIDKPNITLIGEDAENTIITYDVASGSIKLPEHGGDGVATYGTSGSASVTITNKASNFNAVNITFENAFDEGNTEIKSKQAVAVKNEADKTTFVNCRLIGNQDTLYANKNVTQHYYNCYIEGDVDYIFGSATAIFEECELFTVDRPGIMPKGYITAPNTEVGRLGYLILNSKLSSNIEEKGSVYLGRPWHPSSSTVELNSNVVYMNTNMGPHISSTGWDQMSGVLPENNDLFEYGSTGRGALKIADSRRVLSDEDAQGKYSREAFFGGWDNSKTVESLSKYVDTLVVDLTEDDMSDVEIERSIDLMVDASFEGENGSKVDGVKTYSTLEAALDTVSSSNSEEVVIFLKSGIYKEKLTITKPNVTLIGEDAEKTIITYDVAAGSIKLPEHGGDGTATYGTSGSASVTITNKAKNFTAANITFENSFDEKANSHIGSKQSVAVKNESDNSLFTNCRFISNQDTLYANQNTVQYYKNCYIEGDVDFIFGSATAVFDECELFSVDRPGINPKGYITAPSTQEGRKGYLIINSKLTSNIEEEGSVFLGRPWIATTSYAINANTVIRNTEMGAHISAKGWDQMSGALPEDHSFMEYNNTGSGAIESDTRPVISDENAEEYTKEAFLGSFDADVRLETLAAKVKEINSEFGYNITIGSLEKEEPEVPGDDQESTIPEKDPEFNPDNDEEIDPDFSFTPSCGCDCECNTQCCK